jgi:phage tail sheath protein FI
VQRAALRLAAASGDLLVVLSMPRHFRAAAAVRYTQRLRTLRDDRAPADRLAFGLREARALSYGAMYFPWLQSDLRLANVAPAPRPAIELLPPEGVAAGVLAARAARRGAWVAPANEPLKNVVALAPAVPTTEQAVLQDAQINLLRVDPRGFLALSADTLASDSELRPINVRRLLTLLRRLALRRGTSYVFEPNGPALRRSIQRGFEQLLTGLYERGAFAGATPAQSFRVVTDDTINPPQSVDNGRLFVELRVAPALPMRFLAVRLTQTGERLAVVENV